MRERLSDWLESRTGLRTLRARFVGEPIPGGARWRYVFGPALAATFLIQFATGLLLMSSYVPSSGQAWGSVWYIQTQMVLGWFIRGLHHFGSSAMMVLLALHLVQVVATRAYRAPREVNWWLGLALMALVFGLGLTGYLLPWDQKGYWATKVATNIAGSTPVFGPYILQLLVGGSEYGNQTLTRLFSLHVGILPLAILLLLACHVLLYYRHGAAGPEHPRVVEPAWPGQVFRNTVAVTAVLAVLVGVTLWNGGANLEAPADPTSSDYPARPEWYFLALFQMLNYFVSPYETLGTHVLPTLLIAFLAALPILDRKFNPRLVHGFACLVLAAVFAGAGFLMAEALLADRVNETFLLARAKADTQRERALFLANSEGVPPDGAMYILRRDPLVHGREVLDQGCLSCHYHGGAGQVTRLQFDPTPAERAQAEPARPIGDLPEPAARGVAAKLPDFRADGKAKPAVHPIHGPAYELAGRNGKGERIELTVSADGAHVRALLYSKQTASDLKDFGTRAWVRGLLEDPGAPAYFGTNPALKGMKDWKKGSKLTAKQLDAVADFVAQLGETLPGETLEQWYERAYAGNLDQHPGHDLFVNDCGKCHIVGESGILTEGGLMDAPDLFGYGSRDWITKMIRNPGADSLYGYLDEGDRMPAFESELSANDLETLVRYLKGDYPGATEPAAPAASATLATPEVKEAARPVARR